MYFYIISIMWTSIIKIILDRYTFYKRDIKMLHPSACACSSIILWHFHFWLFSSIVWLPKFAVFFVSSMFSHYLFFTLPLLFPPIFWGRKSFSQVPYKVNPSSCISLLYCMKDSLLYEGSFQCFHSFRSLWILSQTWLLS